MKKQAPKTSKTTKSTDALRKDVLRVLTHVRAGVGDGDEDKNGDG
jgi:hypothetical protein